MHNEIPTHATLRHQTCVAYMHGVCFESFCQVETIGDAYMLVGGLPTRNSNHPASVASIAFEMQNAIATFNKRNNLNLK